MLYKKEHVKPDGRRLISSGPRDAQKRLKNIDQYPVDAIQELKKEIKRLSDELRERPVIGGFTGEQMDEEIRKVVSESIKNIKETTSKEIKELKSKLKKSKENEETLLKKLEDIEKAKNDNITKLLKEQVEKLENLSIPTTIKYEEILVDTGRPQIEADFIDPLEKYAGEGLELHINVEDIPSNEKEDVFEKVDKLKQLIGGLPNINK
jgi:predicted RNase H-like nuclease (RuvC/YqgF family)